MTEAMTTGLETQQNNKKNRKMSTDVIFPAVKRHMAVAAGQSLTVGQHLARAEPKSGKCFG